jgi:hypothetical protein
VGGRSRSIVAVSETAEASAFAWSTWRCFVHSLYACVGRYYRVVAAPAAVTTTETARAASIKY